MGQIQKSVGVLFSSSVLGQIGKETIASAKFKEAEAQKALAIEQEKTQKAELMAAAERGEKESIFEVMKDPLIYKEMGREALGEDVFLESDIDTEIQRRATILSQELAKNKSQQNEQVKLRFDKRKKKRVGGG